MQLREDGLALDQIVLSPVTVSEQRARRPQERQHDPAKNRRRTLSSRLFVSRTCSSVAGSSAWVVWATREQGPAEVRYWSGNPGDRFRLLTATARVFKAASTGMPFDYCQHEAQLANLLPATVYNYDIFINGKDATPGVVDQLRSAQVLENGRVNFVAFGDSGTLLPAQFQIANRIANETFDLALHTGDIAYEDGTYQQFHDTFFNVYNSWMRSRPVYPCIGNHDDRTSFGTSLSRTLRVAGKRRERDVSRSQGTLLQFRLRSDSLCGARFGAARFWIPRAGRRK